MKTPILNALEKLIRLGSVIIKPNLTRTFVSYRIKINDEFTKQVQRSIHNLPCLFYLSFTIDLIVHLRRLSECCDLTKMDKMSSLETEPTCRSERALERILGKARYRVNTPAFCKNFNKHSLSRLHSSDSEIVLKYFNALYEIKLELNKREGMCIR